MPTARITVEIPNGKTQQLEMPDDLPIRELLPKLLTALGPFTRNVTYRLYSRKTQRELAGDDILSENGSHFVLLAIDAPIRSTFSPDVFQTSLGNDHVNRKPHLTISYYHDETLTVDLQRLVAGLNELSAGVMFKVGGGPVNISGDILNYPSTHKKLTLPNADLSSGQVLEFIATVKRYDNNYFYEFHESIGVFSFAGWERLTQLPMINGVVYFTCQILSDSLELGESHSQSTGCLNDFLWDKTAVDVGMRSAFLCPKCRSQFVSHSVSDKEKAIFGTLEVLLDQLCLASRSGLSVLDYWDARVGKPGAQFDVFLCHNSDDKDVIRELNARLKEKNIRTWLDEEQLQPGRPWQDELEKQIPSINCVVIAVGKTGTGPWQDMEIRAFLAEFVKRGCPVIPVLLSDCTDIPKLPLFLNQFTWVDLRKIKPDPFNLLLWGITGKKHL
jgi:hypothetical protein